MKIKSISEFSEKFSSIIDEWDDSALFNHARILLKLDELCISWLKGASEDESSEICLDLINLFEKNYI